MKQLVRLGIKSWKDGKCNAYRLRYYDETGKRREKVLATKSKKKAEAARAKLERELLMGAVKPRSMRLSVFLEDSLVRTGSQIREIRSSFNNTPAFIIVVDSDFLFRRLWLLDPRKRTFVHLPAINC